MGDATETDSRCRFWMYVYTFAIYEGVSALGTDRYRWQTQTDAFTT